MAEAVVDQAAILEDATKRVKEQAFYMKHAMDQDDLKATLTHASDMLRELRTGLLTPKNYYEVYMKVLDELRYLELYFSGLQKQGKPVVELYEKVQSCGNVLPRLYLLITVAGVYIQSLQAPARDVLKDLVEMSKGVQHPMRGLFLRNYLTQVSRDKLPDVGTKFEGEGGNVQDAYEFILQNFAEANRLWVRMQNQGVAKDKKKREKERQELRILVGTNLVRLSQLQGVDVNEYKENILPRILEQVTNCKDTIAQSYLMDCIIQVFGDEFHLATLDQFLATCTQLKEKVNVRSILEGMMDRLASYAESNPEAISPELKTFTMFNDCVAKLLEERSNFSVTEVLRLQASLLNYAIKSYPGNLDYINHCINNCAQILETRSAGTQLEGDGVEVVERLLTLPLQSLALRVLQVDKYSSLLSFLPWGSRKQVAVTLVRSILASRSKLTEMEAIDQLFTIILPLLRDPEEGEGQAGASEGEEGEGAQAKARGLEDEQVLVARLVHVMVAPDTDTQYRFLVLARKYFGQGGNERLQYTLPPLVFAALKLVADVRKRETADPPEELQVNSRKVFQFLHETVTAMGPHHPELSLRLFLQCAQAADVCEQKLIAYEFVTQAFLLYEDELTDSKAQIRALSCMVGALLKTRNFDEGDYDALCTKTTQYAAKLLKKPEQCRMVALCSHLFYVGKAEDPKHYHDAKRVIECLQRSVKTADMCIASSQHIHLFVEVLNHYLAHFEAGCPSVTDKYVSALVALINDKKEEAGAGATGDVEVHYRNTLAHIRRKQEAERAAGEEGRYCAIQL